MILKGEGHFGDGGYSEDMAYAISDILEMQDDIEEYMNCIDDDLADLEEEMFADEDEYVEVVCPNCGELIEVDPSILMEPNVEVICPECGEVFNLETSNGMIAYLNTMKMH